MTDEELIKTLLGESIHKRWADIDDKEIKIYSKVNAEFKKQQGTSEHISSN